MINVDENEEKNLNDNKYIFNGKYIRIIEHNNNKSGKKSNKNNKFNGANISLDEKGKIHFFDRYKKVNNIVKKINNKPLSRRIKNKYQIIRRDKMGKGKLTFSECDINSVKKVKYYKENDYKVTCFACDVGCSVSKIGYSKMNFSPYNNLIKRREETLTKK